MQSASRRMGGCGGIPPSRGLAHGAHQPCSRILAVGSEEALGVLGRPTEDNFASILRSLSIFQGLKIHGTYRGVRFKHSCTSAEPHFFVSRGTFSAQELAPKGAALANSRAISSARANTAAPLAASHRVRQELLATLLQPEAAVAGSTEKDGASAKISTCSPPTIGQVRGVVGPLEQALQIYTDMKNAPQAAACHYQVRVCIRDIGYVGVCRDLHVWAHAIGRNRCHHFGRWFFSKQVLVGDRPKEDPRDMVPRHPAHTCE